MDNFLTVILAAGKGTRMKSSLPKVLHRLNGKPMVEYVLDVTDELSLYNRVIVTGEGHELVEETVKNRGKCVLQAEQLGTGHALLQAWDYFVDFPGHVLVLSGDTPLLSASVIQKLIDDYKNSCADISILTTTLDEPGHYGRIVRNGQRVTAIVEYKDGTEEERKIKEINTGTYCFRSSVLKEFLPLLNRENAQGEMYLTDVIGLAFKNGLFVRGFCTEDFESTGGINTRAELASSSKILRKRHLEGLMLDGITVIDPDNTYIEAYVNIGRDSVVYPFTSLEGHTAIGENCIIGPFTRIKDSSVERNSVVENSTVINNTKMNVDFLPHNVIN
ncbi:MAG: NTP transferase domain-containing protein [Candidatus Eremiobacterota bacterium]